MEMWILWWLLCFEVRLQATSRSSTPVTKYIVTEHVVNADEVEVYVSDGETAHLTHNAKDRIIKRLKGKLARKTQIIISMREIILKLKKEIGKAEESSEDLIEDTSEEPSAESSEDWLSQKWETVATKMFKFFSVIFYLYNNNE